MPRRRASDPGVENDWPFGEIQTKEAARRAVGAATVSGAGGTYQTVDNYRQPGYYNSLAIDAAGLAHIAYGTQRIAEDSELRYTQWQSGNGWDSEPVSNAGAVGDPVSLALSASNVPHITYGENGLRYAVKNGAVWNIQLVDAQARGNASLALDGLGRPHIAYYAAAGWEVRYTAWDGTAWDISTLAVGGENAGVALALDQYGYAHVAYGNHTGRGLYYATNVPEPATLSLLALGGLAVIRKRRRSGVPSQ